MIKEAIFMVVMLTASNFGWQYITGEHSWKSAFERSLFQAGAIIYAYIVWHT